MFNMTIINKKDIIKCIVKFSFFILFIYFFYYFINMKNYDNSFMELTNKERFIGCINENISIAKLVFNKEYENMEFEKYKNKFNPLKMSFDSQFVMIGSVLKSENDKNNNIINGISDNENNEEKENNKYEDNKNIELEKSINDNIVEKAKTGLKTTVLDNNVPIKYTDEYNGVYIRNETGYDLTDDMIEPNIEITNKNIIIFHTHTCESYTPTEKYNYDETGSYRTTDLEFTVAKVGDELEKQLKNYGFNVIHDKTYHDFPAYNGSYGRSLETVKNLLNNEINADIIIDLHRDAIGDYTYAPTVKIGEDYASQLMFVIGTDGGGLEHPDWNENLKFAIKVQEKANELYPGLFKPIILRNSRYNQHLSKDACIIEVGATGNTLEQSITSMKYLGKILDEIVNNT